MKASLLASALLAWSLIDSSQAFADSLCISLEGVSLKNACANCVDVTLRELRPPKDQHMGVFSGVTRTVRLEGGRTEDLKSHGNWLIGDIAECR
jgi:hypothetical protein